jgi:hypothetical protein
MALSIQESRRLVLPLETAVQAVLQFDSDSGGHLAHDAILDARIEQDPSPCLVLIVRSRRSESISDHTFNLAALAAAIINYCRLAKIPLPRNAKKTLEIVPEGIAFCVETTINLPRWYSGLSGQRRSAKAITRSAAANPVPEPAPEKVDAA